MKKLYIFIMIIIFAPFVYADNYNVSNSITAPTCSGSNCSGGHYTGLENYNVGANSVYTINTRYNGRLGAVRFNIPLPSALDSDCFPVGDLSYRLTLNMATEDWRNKFARPFISSSSSGSNWATSNVVFTSMKKIYFDFKIPTTNSCYDFLYVYLQSTNQSSVSITGVNNWNLSNITLTANFPVAPTPVPTATPRPDSSNTDIINANNRNTQSIIDNNDANSQAQIDNANQNTENIIENANQNTENIITNDQLSKINSDRNNFDTTDKNCGLLFKYDLSKGKGVYSNGNFFDDDSLFYTEDYIFTEGASRLVLEGFESDSQSVNGANLILYDIYHNVVDYWGVRNRVINLPSNVLYFKYATKTPSGRIFKDNGCESKIDETNEKLNDINNSINNSNVDDKGSFFSDFDDEDFGLSSIITIPLSTIQSLTNTSCLSLTIPIPFTNGSVSLPCMTEVYQQNIPTIFNLWQVVSFGIISYLICIDIFHIVKGFKDPNSDKVEVLDL